MTKRTLNKIISRTKPRYEISYAWHNAGGELSKAQAIKQAKQLVAEGKSGVIVFDREEGDIIFKGDTK
jgi:hypothetical protein